MTGFNISFFVSVIFSKLAFVGFEKGAMQMSDKFFIHGAHAVALTQNEIMDGFLGVQFVAFLDAQTSYRIIVISHTSETPLNCHARAPGYSPTLRIFYTCMHSLCGKSNIPIVLRLVVVGLSSTFLKN